MKHPFYDPKKTYDENFDKGPFGAFAKTEKQQSDKSPRYTFLGHKINSPFGIPAGPLLNSKYVKAAFEMGFDVNVYKTQRSDPFTVNAFPNVLFVQTNGDLTLEKAKKPLVGTTQMGDDEKEFSITNSFGNPSRGPKYWKDDLKKAVSYAGENQLLIMSVVGTIKKGFTDEDYYNDFAASAEIASKAGAQAIELNLSCPNVANEGILCYSADAVESICKKVRSKIGNTPLVVKFGYFSKEQEGLLEDIMQRTAPYIQAVATINTIPAPIVDEKGNQALPGPNRLMSGVCGSGIKWAGIDMVKRLNKLKKEKKYAYEIIGVGGVMTRKDFGEYRKAGADVVMSATGAMWNPYLAQEIKKAL